MMCCQLWYSRTNWVEQFVGGPVSREGRSQILRELARGKLVMIAMASRLCSLFVTTVPL